MKKLGRIISIGLGFGLLAFALSFVPSKPTAAAHAPVVTVANTPLPVSLTGTGNITGTVAATQSGTWNVGLSGTPTASASNFPAAQPVSFGNTRTTPLFVRDVDNSTRAAFQLTCSSTTADSGSFSCNLGTVGTGTRIVIETVSGYLKVPAGISPGDPHLITTVNGSTANHYLRGSLMGKIAGFDSWLFTEDVRLYADASTPINVRANTDATGNTGTGTFTLSGYTVAVL